MPIARLRQAAHVLTMEGGINYLPAEKLAALLTSIADWQDEFRPADKKSLAQDIIIDANVLATRVLDNQWIEA